MALKGDGDPRWVVRDRDDGRNVNSWHWEDKDVTAWAKERLKELITSETCMTGDFIKVGMKQVDSVDGDATLYNRKGVLKVLYDLKVSGVWSSFQEEEEARTHGEFKFELFDEDPQFVVSMDEKSQSDHSMRKLFVNDVTGMIQKQCAIFIREMNAGADQSLDGVRVVEKKTSSDTKVTDFLRSGMEEKAVKKKETKYGELLLKDVFTCRGTDVYLALTDRGRLEAITRAKVVSEVTVGGKVDLMGGTVVGEYKRLLIGKEISMRWKLKTWGEDAKSGDVKICINEEEGKAEVEVQLTGVPNEHRSSTEGFWRVQIFQAIKVVMGWGSASHFL